MSAKSKIIDAIQQIAGAQAKDETLIFPAEVTAVNEGERTCTITGVGTNQEITLEGVLLMAVIEDGLFVVPAIGSIIYVSYSKFNKAIVSQFSKVEKLLWVVGDSSIEIANGKIVMNDGTFAGLVKVAELTHKLNALENKVNDVITTFNSHVHSGVQSGAASSAVAVTPITGNLTPTQQSEIENKNITHG